MLIAPRAPRYSYQRDRLRSLRIHPRNLTSRRSPIDGWPAMERHRSPYLLAQIHYEPTDNIDNNIDNV